MGAPSPDAPTAVPPSTGSDEPAQRDLFDLAWRLGGLVDPPRQVQLPTPAPGVDEEFHVLTLPDDPDVQPEGRTVLATLRAVSEHAYLFVQQGAGVDDGEVDDAVRAFEDEVWPAVTEAFGLPPTPGVDGDPRIVILHADLGAVGGYVSHDDVYPKEVVARSNQREMVYLDLDFRPLGSAGYARVLAHELQHLIQFRLDADEATWVSEGLAEFAGDLVSETPRQYGSFLDQPDTQLNAWAVGGESGAHYGASGLFFDYLFEQIARDARELATERADGVDGVRAFLRAAGSARTFTGVVADWAVANSLDQAEGPYGYAGREVSAPDATVIEGEGRHEGEVRQFATDYLELSSDDFEGGVVFDFEGETEVPVLAAQTDADGTFWWSGRGDSMDATLTRELDLAGVRRATLTFRTWFDIERWFDYGYVVASQDGGRTWDVLAGGHTTTEDPLDVTYGPGYSGRSGGEEAPRWVEESVDLSAYAGSRVLVRFEYVTDDGLTRPGWAIDDIAVPEIGFLDGAESDVGGWHREGFRRLAGSLAQRFELRLITFGPGPAVEEIALDEGNRARVDLAGLGTEYGRAILVIVGATQGTMESAAYRYEISTAPME
jgi:hypothetical protein